ncbi:unnamed protein product [Cuscuta epithymum]|uniref:Uncharacterized protein n=1 Tax=Cuscuta epithymum TaxID=186058 RepID=A0AAV0FY44_9ASTE|nr:unnamed protein product [Cuscuta epithymum]CAH9140411.1 unnamed protein product [Cuscuta epithymum]
MGGGQPTNVDTFFQDLGGWMERGRMGDVGVERKGIKGTHGLPFLFVLFTHLIKTKKILTHSLPHPCGQHLQERAKQILHLPSPLLKKAPQERIPREGTKVLKV